MFSGQNQDKDKDKEALFNVAYNVTDNISSRAILRHSNIFNSLLYLPSTTPLYVSVSKGAASTSIIKMVLSVLMLDIPVNNFTVMSGQ